MQEGSKSLFRLLLRVRHAALLCGVFFIGLFLFSPDVSAANPPTVMNFQGRLTNSSGNIVADGSYNMKFAIYDASTGGTLIWSETRETTDRVVVTNGLFSVKIGAVSGLNFSHFVNNTNLYFEIQMATPATATCSTAACATYETPMTPRSQMATSAYAFSASSAASAQTATTAGTSFNSLQLNGVNASSYARQDAANTFTTSNTFQAASTFTSTALSVLDDAAAFQVQNAATLPFFTADTSAGGSSILIGSTTPDASTVQFVLDSATADPTGQYGGSYYNSSSNNFRCFKDTWWQDCGPQTKKLTADVANNTTALADLTGMSFAMLASTDYSLTCNIVYQTAITTTGIRFALNGPASPVAVAGSFMTNTSATAVGSGMFSAYEAGGTSTGVVTANTNIPATLNATIRNGVNAGTLQVRFNSEVAASNVSVRTGSSCQMTRL